MLEISIDCAGLRFELLLLLVAYDDCGLRYVLVTYLGGVQIGDNSPVYKRLIYNNHK